MTCNFINFGCEAKESQKTTLVLRPKLKEEVPVFKLTLVLKDEGVKPASIVQWKPYSFR